MESVNYQKRYHTAFWNATMFIYFCGCVQALMIIGDVILIFRCPLNIIKSSNMKCTKSSDSFQFLFFWSPYQKSPRRGGRDDSRDRRRRWRVASGWDVPLSPGRVTLPTSAQRAAGGGLPLFFPGRTSGDAKPGSDGVLFFHGLCYESWWSHNFWCSSASLVVCMPFVIISKTWLLCESSGHDNHEPLSRWKWDCWLLRC